MKPKSRHKADFNFSLLHISNFLLLALKKKWEFFGLLANLFGSQTFQCETAIFEESKIISTKTLILSKKQLSFKKKRKKKIFIVFHQSQLLDQHGENPDISQASSASHYLAKLPLLSSSHSVRSHSEHISHYADCQQTRHLPRPKGPQWILPNQTNFHTSP